MPPPLGWVEPVDRTAEQNKAHADAVAAMPNFAIQAPLVTGPVKVMLTDFWKSDDVKTDIGREFTGFHQLTGSCVGASAGNAIATLSFVQRSIADQPTQAFVPWWPFFYGRTRYNEGDRGQGEGAVDSVMGQTLKKEGVFSAKEQGLPWFREDDGFYLTEKLEYQWSDGGSKLVIGWAPVAKEHLVGTVAPLYTTDDIKAAIVNGYPVLDGCSMYVGHGKVVGSGDSAYVQGHYDGRGGHSTCFLGYWDHPNDGPIFAYCNQWGNKVYPPDPAGLPPCCVWMTETEVKKLFTLYGGANGETMALSHLSYFPAQPAVVDWLVQP